MGYQVELMRVQPQATAVVRYRAQSSELAIMVPRGCGEVWAFLRAVGAPRLGRNLALYLDGEINLECGVEVDEPFAGNDRVFCSRTPGGLVATAAHVGPYDRLGDAHAAICKWCRERGHTLVAPNWEVYGHWTDNPAELRTDVYYLL
jgi:effector-binding domain-containing protein